MISHSKPFSRQETQTLLGDVRALGRILGSPAGITLAQEFPPDESFRGRNERLALILRKYTFEVLVPSELTVIRDAYGFTERGQALELIELDQRLQKGFRMPAFAAASVQTGQRQLIQLKPLRDHRVVQKYIRSVDSGEAKGWHTVVYGLTLAVYSLPLVEGVLNYAEQTLFGLAGAATAGHGCNGDSAEKILRPLLGELPAFIAETARCSATLRSLS